MKNLFLIFALFSQSVFAASGSADLGSSGSGGSGGSGSNIHLSNLSSVAINADMIPDTNETINLGTFSSRYLDVESKNGTFETLNGGTFSAITGGFNGITTSGSPSISSLSSSLDLLSQNNTINISTTGASAGSITISRGASGGTIVLGNGELDFSYDDFAFFGSNIDWYGLGNGTAPTFSFWDGNQNHAAIIKVPNSLSANYTLTLPADDGESQQSLSSDGSGVLSWRYSPTGTICGWYDTVGIALVTSCMGSNPNTSCPTGYTQKSTTGAKFCSAN